MRLRRDVFFLFIFLLFSITTNAQTIADSTDTRLLKIDIDEAPNECASLSFIDDSGEAQVPEIDVKVHRVDSPSTDVEGSIVAKIGSETIVIKRPVEIATDNATFRKYEAEVGKGVPLKDVLNFVLTMFAKEKGAFDAFILHPCHANTSNLIVETLTEIKIHFRTAELHYAGAPDENLIQRFVGEAGVHDLKIETKERVLFSDNFFSSSSMEMLDRLSLPNSIARITDETLGDSKIRELELFKVPFVSPLGVQKWMQPVLYGQYRNRRIFRANFDFEPDEETLLMGLTYSIDEAEPGRSWIIQAERIVKRLLLVRLRVLQAPPLYTLVVEPWGFADADDAATGQFVSPVLLFVCFILVIFHAPASRDLNMINMFWRFLGVFLIVYFNRVECELKIEMPPPPFYLSIEINSTRKASECSIMSLQDVPPAGAPPKPEIDVQVFLTDELDPDAADSTSGLFNTKSGRPIFIRRLGQDVIFDNATRTKYVVNVLKTIPRTELIEFLFETFAKKQTFDAFHVYHCRSSKLTDAVLETLCKTGMKLKYCEVKYDKPPKEKLIVRLIKAVAPKTLVLHSEKKMKISDAFFKNPAVRSVDSLTLPFIETSISDDTLAGLNMSSASIGKASRITPAGIRRWMQPCLNLDVNDKKLTAVLSFIVDEKVLDGLDYKKENVSEGDSWTITNGKEAFKFRVSEILSQKETMSYLEIVHVKEEPKKHAVGSMTPNALTATAASSSMSLGTLLFAIFCILLN